MRLQRFFSLVGIGCFAAACATHGTPAAIAGRWSGAVDLTAGRQTNRIVILCEFHVDGQSVTGSVGPAPDTQFRIQSGRFDGKTLVFSSPMPTRVYTITLRVVGTNRMMGTVIAEDGKARGVIAVIRESAIRTGRAAASLPGIPVTTHAVERGRATRAPAQRSPGGKGAVRSQRT